VEFKGRRRLQIYVAGEGLSFRPVGEATPVVPSDLTQRTADPDRVGINARQTHTGSGGRITTEFGGAALTTSSAVKKSLFAVWFFFSARVTWLIVCVSFFLRSRQPQRRAKISTSDAPASARSYLFSAFFDYASARSYRGHSSADPQAAANSRPPRTSSLSSTASIHGQPRVRSDTLKARISAAKGRLQ